MYPFAGSASAATSGTWRHRPPLFAQLDPLEYGPVTLSDGAAFAWSPGMSQAWEIQPPPAPPWSTSGPDDTPLL